MSVSLYYEATRPTPLTPEERTRVEALAEQYTASFREDDEGLTFYDEPSQGQLLQGSTKMPQDFERLDDVLGHLFGALTSIRRTLPGSEWLVTLDDTEVEWNQDRGFSLPGIEPLHDGAPSVGRAGWWQKLRSRLTGQR